MRRLMVSMGFAVGLAALAGGAAAQTTSTPPPQGAPATTTPAPADAAATTKPEDAVVCHYEKMTGSLFTTRICHTQREWKLKTQDARDTMDKADQQGSGQSRGQ